MSCCSFFLREEVKVGDIFKPNTCPGSQLLSRAWHFVPATDNQELPSAIDSQDVPHSSGHGHKILLRHCLSSGKWVLIIDGLPHIQGCEPIMNRKFEIFFSIKPHLTAVITVTGKTGMSIGYTHSLVVEESEIPEIKRNIDTLSVGDNPPEHVSIPDTRLYNDGERDVTLYQILIKPYQGGQIIAERRCVPITVTSTIAIIDIIAFHTLLLLFTNTLLYLYYRTNITLNPRHLVLCSYLFITSSFSTRRFSEFIALSTLIKALKDKHSGALPVLPRRIFTPWTDQQSVDFINERRAALQLYLRALLANPRVCSYTEFLCFLGLDPVTGNPLQEPLSVSLLGCGSDDSEEGFQN